MVTEQHFWRNTSCFQICGMVFTCCLYRRIKMDPYWADQASSTPPTTGCWSNDQHQPLAFELRPADLSSHVFQVTCIAIRSNCASGQPDWFLVPFVHYCTSVMINHHPGVNIPDTCLLSRLPAAPCLVALLPWLRCMFSFEQDWRKGSLYPCCILFRSSYRLISYVFTVQNYIIGFYGIPVQ